MQNGNGRHSQASLSNTSHANANHFVRYSVLGNIARFATTGGLQYPRGAKVVLQTDRGLELGEVLRHTDSDSSQFSTHADYGGTILRLVTDSDRMLAERLDRYRLKAMDACDELLAARSVSAVLVDGEQLFDGESLFFYFLGEVTDEINEITSELAATYDTQIQFKRFAQTLAEGCGPDCGTKEGGCESGGCSTCAIASACSK